MSIPSFGDVNVAATDSDVFHPDAFVGATHVSPGERAALAALYAAGLVDVLDGGELAHQPVDGGLVDLPLAVGLVGLVGVAVQVADHLGDRHGIAGVDLRLVLLRPAAPHRALDARAG